MEEPDSKYEVISAIYEASLRRNEEKPEKKEPSLLTQFLIEEELKELDIDPLDHLPPCKIIEDMSWLRILSKN